MALRSPADSGSRLDKQIVERNNQQRHSTCHNSGNPHGVTMRQCAICGKAPSAGNSIVYRGMLKKKGGVGRKTVRVNLRRFLPNLQNIKILLNGAVKRTRVNPARASDNPRFAILSFWSAFRVRYPGCPCPSRRRELRQRRRPDLLCPPWDSHRFTLLF